MSDQGPSNPPPAPPITVDDLIAKVHALDDARTALASARTDTANAQTALTNTTVSLQAAIDQATAAYDSGTTAAKQVVTDKQTAEAAAGAAEQAVFDDLEAALQSFK